MKKGIAWVPLILIIFLLGAGGLLATRLFFGGNEDSWICQNGDWVKHGNPSNSKPTTPCIINSSTTTQTVNQPTPAESSPTAKNTAIVPLPTGEDIVRTFFELINEKRIPEAVNMMSKMATGDESQKQAWGVQFNAFTSIKAKSIEAFSKETWTDKEQEYKVNLTVQMKTEAANAVMPNYGFDNGDNIRWVILVKEDNLWKVQGIGTGP